MVKTATFRIELDLATYTRSSTGAITGVIFLRLNDTIFPDDRWNDFPVAVAGWWCEAAERLVQQPSEVFPCNFMDGPFTFEIGPLGDAGWHIALIDRRHSRRVIEDATVSPSAVVEAILGCSAAVVEFCRKRDWHSNDLSQLIVARELLDEARKARGKRSRGLTAD